jgi:uncharacterized membrane protein/predicted DsbA family dithiol-disulfide isomerase
MNKKTKILFVSLLATIGVFIYLTLHHYSIKLGVGGSSLCSINSALNCDAAAASSFAEIAGIPIAILGGVFHLILLGFVAFYSFGWIDASPYLRNLLRGMLVSSAVVSVVMAVISAVAVKVACPFCVASYILSFLNLYLGWNLVRGDEKGFDFAAYFTEYRSYLIALLAIPALSWVFASMIQSHYGLDQVRKYIPEKIAIWKAGIEYKFDPEIGLNKRVENAKYTIVEFADFKCGHCKHASSMLELYLAARPDVNFIFKPYPLDGTCNADMPRKGDGSRCTLAAYVICADKLAKKGWEMSHWIFEHQERLIPVSDAKTLLAEIEKELGLEQKALGECADSAETFDILTKSSAEGTAAKVEGTPTIYVNGKKLPWGQMLEVLKEATSQ